MPTTTITQKEFRDLLKRQEKVERALDILKQIVKMESEEQRIHPSILRRWERISREMDRDKGRAFYSMARMKQWLKNL